MLEALAAGWHPIARTPETGALIGMTQPEPPGGPLIKGLFLLLHRTVNDRIALTITIEWLTKSCNSGQSHQTPNRSQTAD